MRKASLIALSFILAVSMLFGQAQEQRAYRGVTVSPSYSYHMSGRTDWIKGYFVRIDDPQAIRNPGLVFLASGIDHAGEALLKVNGKDYDVPPLEGDFSGRAKPTANEASGKSGFYAYERGGDDVVAKIVVPLKASDLRAGANQVEFYRSPDSDGFEIPAAQVESVEQREPAVLGQTYHLLSRGRPATVRDFDAVIAVKPEDHRRAEEVPEWARRGMVNFYRAGMPTDQLERMFQMFEEAHVNLISVGVPRQKDSEAYSRARALIERCHAKGLKAVGFNSLGGVPLREVLLNPEVESWVARDEYGNKLWQVQGSSFAADISDKGYRRSVLDHAALQIDAGVDELYYDYALGGTGDVRTLFAEIRAIAKQKGKNISVFGNCKGNILVDEIADLVKSEGTEEAGVWDGKWVHNIPQARFYYGVAEGGKRYESKYEGADPGVPNPGAHDVREGMKCGWRKPIAEASAFQSEFAIAEAGEKLLSGWIHLNHPLAVQSWKEICTYFGFRHDNRDLYTDVSTVSKIGVIAPPLIPSFEVSLRRESLYKALAEMNIMYEVLLLHRISADRLARYKTVIITDIPWMEASQAAAIKTFKQAGGKIYAIGGAKKFRDMADVVSPADLFAKLSEPSARKTLAESLRRLEGEPLVMVEGAPYVAANLAKKNRQNRFFLHLVNYDRPLKDVRVKVNLDGIAESINAKGLRLYSPDAVPKTVNVTRATGKSVEFVVPALEVYDVITFD
ncbi:MAG TPA: hypothetical protein VLE22_24975 [Bryobacteraceae bacterium]|nr:hypothetical protein [Bryobacteraceae bacterium]